MLAVVLELDPWKPQKGEFRYQICYPVPIKQDVDHQKLGNSISQSDKNQGTKVVLWSSHTFCMPTFIQHKNIIHAHAQHLERIINK